MSLLTLSLAVPAMVDGYIPGCFGEGQCDYDFPVYAESSHCVDHVPIYSAAGLATAERLTLCLRECLGQFPCRQTLKGRPGRRRKATKLAIHPRPQVRRCIIRLNS
jgi:hypothetical protein